MALLVFFSHPSEYIFLYIKNWPTTSDSSESLLIRRHDNQVEYLSPLRFLPQADRPLSEYTITDNKLVSALALQDGKAGSVKGFDYRGRMVLASYYPVEGTNWMMLSKVDVSEADASLNDLIFWISVVSLISLIFIGLAFVVVLRKQKHLESYRLLAKKTESERVLQQFYELPFIGMAILDPSVTHWTRFNERFRAMLGYSENQLKEISFFDLLPSDEVTLFKQKFAEVASRQREGFTQEARFVGSDKALIYVVASVQCTRKMNGDVQHYLLTVQDTTELRQLGERYIERQNHLNILLGAVLDN